MGQSLLIPRTTLSTFMKSGIPHLILGVRTFFNDWHLLKEFITDPNGFNLPLILNTLNVRVEDLLEADRAIDNLGGRSLIALLIPSPLSYVDEKDYDYCQRYMERLRWRLPNLHFIYYGGGALVRFHDFVRDPSKDLCLLNTEKPPESCGDPVITRIRQGNVS